MPSRRHRRPPLSPARKLTQDSALSAKIARTPARILAPIRQELDLLDKELQALSLSEKTRVVQLARERVHPVRRVGHPPHPQQWQPPPQTMNGAQSVGGAGGLPLNQQPPNAASGAQPTTTLPEMPPSFSTPEFMQSVAGSLDEFDTHNLLDTTTIEFEQDFREWFNPDDLDMK